MIANYHLLETILNSDWRYTSNSSIVRAGYQNLISFLKNNAVEISETS
jgi:hypothetical protein